MLNWKATIVCVRILSLHTLKNGVTSQKTTTRVTEIQIWVFLECVFRLPWWCIFKLWFSSLWHHSLQVDISPLNAELNAICQLLALLGAQHILHISRIRVNGWRTWWLHLLGHSEKVSIWQSWVDKVKHSCRYPHTNHVKPEEAGGTLLENVATHLQDYMVSQPITGHAMAQTISCWPPTEDTQDWSQVNSCKICGQQNGKIFFLVFQFPLSGSFL